MADQLLTIITNELRALIRERTFILLLGTFFAMALFSSYIGCATRNTTLEIYHASVLSLQQAGVVHIPTNPFLALPPLSIFRNMTIYIFLIGALLAIVMGHQTLIRDRKSRVTQLIFSKSVDKPTFLLGKIMGLVTALTLIVLATFLISLVSAFSIPAQQLSAVAVGRLALFYLVSLLYLLIFALLGLGTAVIFDTESLALLVPIIIWVGVTFIVPELITGQNPVALLNPTNLASVAPSGDFFTLMHAVLSPIAIEQQYTQIAQSLLETQAPIPVSSIWMLFFYFALMVIIDCYAIAVYQITTDKLYE